MSLAVITLILGSSVLTAVVTALAMRPKTRADAQKAAAEAGATIDERWKGWADKLEERVAALEQDLTHERRITRLLLAWALGLRNHLIRVGETPEDPPEDVRAYVDGGDGPIL